MPYSSFTSLMKSMSVRAAPRRRASASSPAGNLDRHRDEAGDACLGRDIGAVREVRHRLVGDARELVLQPQRGKERQPARPDRRSVERRVAGRVLEAEQRTCVGRRPLVRHRTLKLVAPVDRLQDARLEVLLPCVVGQRDLVVEPAVILDIRQRVIRQQRRRLWTDAIAREPVLRKRHARDRIDDLHGPAEPVARFGEVAGAFERRRHPRRRGRRVGVIGALEPDGEVRPVAERPRNRQQPLERAECVEVCCSRAWRRVRR